MSELSALTTVIVISLVLSSGTVFAIYRPLHQLLEAVWERVASERRPLPAVSLSEVLATSDLPGGVVNVLTGFTAELAPWLASHRDVNAIDLTGVAPDDRAELQRAAADNVKRVYVPWHEDWDGEPGLARLTAFVETKTVWHPNGV